MNGEPITSRPLPHHERHRRALLTAIAAEAAREQAPDRPRRSDWLAPALAAAAVLIVAAAGVGAHALLRPASQPGHPGARQTPPAAASSAGPGPAAIGSGNRSVTARYTIAASISSLIVRDPLGSVSVVGGSGTEVSVTARMHYRTTRPSISRAVSGRTLSLGYSDCADCGVAFTITVPRTASVTVNAATGSVTLSNLAGQVTVSDDNGMITLANLAGDLSVRDSSGGISGTGLSAPQAEFRSGTGMIDVAFSAPPRRLSAVTDIGMVSVHVPSGTTYRITASSRLGLVDESVHSSPTATHLITAVSDLGMVSVSAAD